MGIIAFMLDGLPSSARFTQHWLSCVLVPSSVILFSWIAVRRRQNPFPTLLALAFVAALVVVRPAYDLIDFGYPFFPTKWFVASPWIAAALPFIAIRVLHLLRLSKSLPSPATDARTSFVDRHLILGANLASVAGLAWLYSEYAWIPFNDEEFFFIAWLMVALVLCSAVIFAWRYFRRSRVIDR